MQAVILSAGKSSRLFPYSENKHKAMISLCGKPLLVQTIEQIKSAGVTDVIIVVNEKSDIPSFIKTLDLHITTSFVLLPDALGMGDALLATKEKLEDNFFVLHGNHVDAGSIIKKILEKKTSQEVILAIKNRSDYWTQGVVTIEKNKIVSVLEKPKKDKDIEKPCIVGVYYLSKDFIKTLSNTPLEHYQFETALSAYAKHNVVSFVTLSEATVSLKYPWDLLEVKDYLLGGIKNYRGKNTTIAESAEIIGVVWIGDNVIIREGAKIKGPGYIGNNVSIGTNAIVRNGCIIEKDCVVGAQMEVKNSILMQGTTTHSGFIGDSVIGEGCKIAANFITANVRLDRKNVKATVRGEVVDTGKKSLGVIMGNNVKVGVQSSTMPGVIIGNNTVIGPSTVVKNNIPSDVRYYTKFQEIIEEKQ